MSIPSLNNLVLNNNSLLPSSHQSQLSHSHLSMHQHSSMNHGGVGMMSSAPSHPSQQQQQQQQAAAAAAKMMRVAASTGVAGVNNNMIGVPILSAGHFPTSNPTGQPLGIGGIGGAGNPSAANPSMTGMGGVGGANPLTTQARLYQHVLDLTVPEKRESALLELSKKREEFPELAPLLWHSFGTIASLLQEIVAIYPLLSPPRLTPMISNRCCNALALLQCVASHPETRSLFLHSHLGLFLYPFLNTVCTFRQYEYLRLTSLGVIGALVKMDDPEVISFLLQTEIIPLCLRIMDNGSELSKTVATFIIQKILLDDMGLNYICATFERFSTVASVLAKMVSGLVERPSVRLLKHIVRCYLRLSDNARAREALRSCLPTAIRDSTFAEVLKDDPTTKRWLTQLLYNIGDSLVPGLVTPNATPTVGGVGGVGLVGPASSPTDNQ